MSSRIVRNILWGVAFCLICIWGSYFTFENYVEQMKEREAYTKQIKSVTTKFEQLKLDSERLAKSKDAELERSERHIRALENDQRELNEQLSYLKRQVQMEQNKQKEKERDRVRYKEVQDPAAVVTEQPLSSMRPVGQRPRPILDLDYHANFTGTTYHIISHTHWDREWYLPFETFRARLVRLLDTVLHRIEDDEDFKHFHLDGQMVPADDYIQVREHMRDIIHQANIDGRIALGPWYVQPDEFLVSAEALVRNLQLGIMRANQMGGTSLVGYIPDSFGHIAQMPQLLLGFGIDSAVSGRGIPNHFGSTELWWEGPDGSRVLFIFLKKWYCNGLDMPSNEWGLGSWFDRKDQELRAAGAKTSHLLLMNGCDHTAPDPNVGDLIVSANRAWKQSGQQKKLAVHSNMDDYVDLVKMEINRRRLSLEKWTGEMRVDIETLTNTLSNKITQKQANWRLQTLLERWVEPMEALAWKFRGRKYDHDTIWYAWRLLLENHPHDSICGCSAAEVHSEVDMRFQKCRQVAEQLSTLSLMSVIGGLSNGVTGQKDVVNLRGKLFVFNPTNIPRNGEVIFAEIESRFDSGKVLVAYDLDGNRVPAHAFEALNRIWSYELPDVGFRRPVTRDWVRVAVQVSVPPFGYQAYRFEWVVAAPEEAALVQARGGGADDEPMRPADYHGMPDSVEKNQKTQRRLLESENENDYNDNNNNNNEIENDYNDNANNDDNNNDSDNEFGKRGMRNLLQVKGGGADPMMENEHLIVRVGKDGQVRITLKAENVEFTGLHRFEDTGDSGDQYGFRRAGGTHTSSEQGSQIHAPKHFPTHSIIEGRVMVNQKEVKVFYILTRGSRRLDIRTEYDNRDYNHRLRVQFTVSSQVTYADSQFETIKRSGNKYYPQLKYVLVHNPQNHQGLLIANRGLPEYQLEGNTLSITLIRSTDRIGDWGKFPVPSAQEQGPNAYEYSIVPFVAKPGGSHFGLADLEARKFNEPIGASWGREVDGFIPEALIDMSMSELRAFSSPAALNSGPQRKMPTEPVVGSNLLGSIMGPENAMWARSLIDLRPHGLVLSAFKKAEDRDSLILRFFNPYETTEDAELYISAMLPFSKAYRCDINEQRKSQPEFNVEPLPDGSKVIKVIVTQKKIVTVELANEK